MLKPFKTEFYSLIYKSISKKTWKVYKNAKNTLEEFRENINRTMILADFDVFDSNIETTATLSME
jgi:hypothetical protein